MLLMDEIIESVRKCFSDHFTTRHNLGVDLVEDGFEVFTLIGFLGVEELEEFMNELGGNVHLDGFGIACFVQNKLDKELIDALQIRPGRVDFFFLLDSSLREGQSTSLLDVR